MDLVLFRVLAKSAGNRHRPADVRVIHPLPALATTPNRSAKSTFALGNIESSECPAAQSKATGERRVLMRMTISIHQILPFVSQILLGLAPHLA
jgi:hypothetical protein